MSINTKRKTLTGLLQTPAADGQSTPATEAPPAPAADLTPVAELPSAQVPSQAALWSVVDDATNVEIARVYAATTAAAVQAAVDQTGRQTGISVVPVPEETAAPLPGRPAARTGGRERPRTAPLSRPAVPKALPRRRAERVAKDKLTVQISVSLLDALGALVERDGTRRYDEVEEALVKHLTAKGIPIEE